MLLSQIKTASQLKSFTESYGTAGHFWDRKTMKFFGDTMSNYGVCRVTVLCNYDIEGVYSPEGVERTAFELYRKMPVKHNNQKSVYFCTTTLKIIHPKDMHA